MPKVIPREQYNEELSSKIISTEVKSTMNASNPLESSDVTLSSTEDVPKPILPKLFYLNDENTWEHLPDYDYNDLMSCGTII